MAKGFLIGAAAGAVVAVMGAAGLSLLVPLSPGGPGAPSPADRQTGAAVRTAPMVGNTVEQTDTGQMDAGQMNAGQTDAGQMDTPPNTTDPNTTDPTNTDLANTDLANPDQPAPGQPLPADIATAPAPPNPAPRIPGAEAGSAADSDATAAGAAEATGPLAEDAPEQTALPSPAAPVTADTAPGTQPSVGATPEAPVAQSTDITAPARSDSASEAPPVTAPVAAGTQAAPMPDAAATVSTDPAQPLPQAQDAPAQDTATAEAPERGVDDAADPAPQDSARPTNAALPQIGANPPALATAPEADQPEDTGTATDAASTDPSDAAPLPTEQTETEIAALPQIDGAGGAEDTAIRPRVGRPAGSFVTRDAAPDSAAPEATTNTASEGDPPPLLRFAAENTAPDDLPRVAVILIDDGSSPLGPEEMSALPFPVSFAIDPGHPDAAATARAYRAQGFEVLALARLPDGAQPSDVEIGLSALIDAVPEVVGLVEAPDASLQGSRDVSAQVAAFLAASGHGVVMQPKGLNTAQQLALKEGVPSVTLFRDFDGAGESVDVIQRVLANAAFRARQEGAVVVLGRLRADSISGLMLWGLNDKSAAIALVPASVVLRESVEAP